MKIKLRKFNVKEMKARPANTFNLFRKDQVVEVRNLREKWVKARITKVKIYRDRMEVVYDGNYLDDSGGGFSGFREKHLREIR